LQVLDHGLTEPGKKRKEVDGVEAGCSFFVARPQQDVQPCILRQVAFPCGIYRGRQALLFLTGVDDGLIVFPACFDIGERGGS
jgi:hypothetical protein